MRHSAQSLGLMLLALVHSAYAGGELRFIVKYKEQIKDIVHLQQQIAQETQLQLKSITPMAGSQYVILLNATSNSIKAEEVLNKFRQNPQVLYAVPDQVGHFTTSSITKVDTDTLSLSHDRQWNEFAAPGGVVLEHTSGSKDGAWAYTQGASSKPIVIAVLDTGIALNNSLNNSLVKDANGSVWGWNFSGNNRDLNDQTGLYHGTHLAGIIAGYGNVMTGIGSDLKILPVKITDSKGYFYESQVINAIYWSVGHSVPGVPDNPFPAKVLNMAFGMSHSNGHKLELCDEALHTALSYARQNGAVVVTSSGDQNLYDLFEAPAVCPGIIRLAATGPEGLRAPYSNHGPSITYAAPGGDSDYGKAGGILSTVNSGGGYQGSGFDFYQGTSMATAHAAGIAGLIFAVKSGAISPRAVEKIMWATTHDFGVTRNRNKSCMGKKPCGHGILDANNAVQAALAGYDVIFSAPVFIKNDLNACKQGYSLNKQQVINQHWSVDNSKCQSEELFTMPKIKQTGTMISAFYGNTSLKFDTSDFKECRVIGVDGVGCYL